MATFDAELTGLTSLVDELDDIEDRWAGESHWLVGTGVEYAVYLEFGTRDMDPRPFVGPVVNEVRTQGIDGFLRANTRTSVDAITSADGLVRALALAMERRIKELITEKGLIDTGTLRASIRAVPGTAVGDLPTADDIGVDEQGNPIDAGATAQFEIET